MDVLACTVLKTSLTFPVQEIGELQLQLQSSEREKEMLRQQLMRKEAEMTGAEETIRREMRQLVHVHVEGVLWDFPFSPSAGMCSEGMVVGFVCPSVCLSVHLSMLKLACSKFICSANNIGYLM